VKPKIEPGIKPELEPRIEELGEKKLIGMRMAMSLTDNRTAELWRSFMPRRKEIGNNIGTDLYSLQMYGETYFRDFNPSAEFVKWAAIEVKDFEKIPDGMEALVLPDGLYAVFLHRGAASTGPKTFEYIFGTWLPNSEYALDNRPHFEVLGEKYKNDDPSSEEEIWIPIKAKD
jgi:AraC family transcriptional regulator